MSNYYRHLIEAISPAQENPFANAIAYYKLDETSGQAIDSISGFNGILNGGVNQGVPGKIGTAYNFSGNGYVDIGALNLNISNAFSLSAWVRSKGVNDTGDQIIGADGDNVVGRFWQFKIKQQKLQFIRFNGSIVVTFIEGGVVDDTELYHVVATFSRTNGSHIYVNGTEVAFDNVTTQNNQGIGSNVFLGATPRAGGVSFLTGDIDEVSIYPNYKLTQNEINYLYNNGIGNTI